jgi:hypothetical protein
LRTIQSSGVDSSNVINALTYAELKDENFKTLTEAELKQLRRIVSALTYIERQRAVPPKTMLTALTAEQHTAYLQSFDTDISPIESEEDEALPVFLIDYAELLKQGDRYTRTANLFRRSKKRDMNGFTAFSRYENKAFGYYEEAVAQLVNVLEMDKTKNPFPNPILACTIERWLDREVKTEAGFEPDVSIEGVPRIRGSASKYCLMKTRQVVGDRLRRHWRQRIAVVEAALDLIYTEVELINPNYEAMKSSLLEKIKRMRDANHKED